MLTPTQLANRKKGLGGTDIAPILGLHPYKTAYDVYLDKTSDNPMEVPENDDMKAGRILEPAIVKWYEEETGLETIELDEHKTFTHPHYPHFIAHPDRLIKGQEKGLEIKNTGMMNMSQWGSPEELKVPIHHCLQIVHYMLVTGYQEWDLAVLIGGNRLKIYPFYNDDKIKDIHAIIEAECHRFWRNNVEKKTPPTFIPNTHSKNALLKYYSTIEEKEIHFDQTYFKYKEEYLKHSQLAKEHGKLADISKAHLLKGMENATKGTFFDGSYILRQKITSKAYTVAAKEYIKISIKNANGKERNA